MYCPTHFAEQRLEVLLDLIVRHPLATIVSQGPDGLVADHIPMFHQPAATGEFGQLIGHVAKNNPLWQTPPDQPCLLVFQGPDTYVSPNWYATKADAGKVVPTWNYAVVHAHGHLTAVHDPVAIRAMLTRLTDTHEAAQDHPWQVADAPEDFTERLIGQIVGIEITVSRLSGKWKVSQNQPDKNRCSVIDGLGASTHRDAAEMARLVARFGVAGKQGATRSATD